MCANLTRFYIPLPGSKRVAPRVRRRPKADSVNCRDMPSYLRELPRLHDFLTLIASCPELTQAEEICLDRHVRRLAKLVREARERWRDELGMSDEELEAAGLL